MTDDEGPSDLTLLDVLTAAAEDLPGIEAEGDDDARRWSAGSVLFATMDGDRAEFRLDPRVAGAALRTPDTSPSARGADWVAFSPSILDDGAVDRAEAWFLSAHRRAAGESTGPSKG
jgi:hypothetical protein